MPKLRMMFAVGVSCLIWGAAQVAAQEPQELQNGLQETQNELQEPQNGPQIPVEPQDAPQEPQAALNEPQTPTRPLDAPQLLPGIGDLFGSALSALQSIFPEGEDAQAAIPAPPPEPDYETDPDIARIDKLFLRLANLSEEDSHAAEGLVSDIMAELSRHESPTAEFLLKRARLASQLGQRGQAIDHVTRAIAFQPDFAEAWHFRATIHFEQDNYGLAIRDLNQALRAEPRHFAAWVGLGLILEELGHERAAAAAYRSALAWHPYLTRAQEKLQAIEDALFGEPA